MNQDAISDPTSDTEGVQGEIDETKGLSDIQRAQDALTALSHHGHTALAATLSRLLDAVASEALRTPRFAKALTQALSGATPPTPKPQPKKGNRRTPGMFDPFAIFAESGRDGLRTRLEQVGLEQLRDIVAEHGMDNDRLAMKWKDRDRVIGRIMERVEVRAAKGSAFRA